MMKLSESERDEVRDVASEYIERIEPPHSGSGAFLGSATCRRAADHILVEWPVEFFVGDGVVLPTGERQYVDQIGTLEARIESDWRTGGIWFRFHEALTHRVDPQCYVFDAPAESSWGKVMS